MYSCSIFTHPSSASFFIVALVVFAISSNSIREHFPRSFNSSKISFCLFVKPSALSVKKATESSIFAFFSINFIGSAAFKTVTKSVQ